MSSLLERWPYSRRSLWITVGAVVVVVVLVVVLVLTAGRGGSGGTASPSDTAPEPTELAAPTPIPVETVVPGPAPSAAVTVAPLGDQVVTAGPREDATDAGVSVRLVSLRPIQTQAYERGEATGDGLAVTIAVTNTSDADLDLATGVDVTLWTATPPMPVLVDMDGHNSPFPKDTLAPGETAERTVAFNTANAPGTPVAVQVLIGTTSFSFQATVGS